MIELECSLRSLNWIRFRSIHDFALVKTRRPKRRISNRVEKSLQTQSWLKAVWVGDAPVLLHSGFLVSFAFYLFSKSMWSLNDCQENRMRCRKVHSWIKYDSGSVHSMPQPAVHLLWIQNSCDRLKLCLADQDVTIEEWGWSWAIWWKLDSINKPGGWRRRANGHAWFPAGCHFSQ